MLKPESVDSFFEFTYDRQLIYHKKEVLKILPPWTDNEILDKCKLCNVYRELDRGTKYIINVIDNIKDNEKLFFNIVTYRVFNLDGLFENIFTNYLDPFNFKFSEYERMLDEAIKKGNIFNSAYIVTQMPWPKKEYRRGTKHPQFLMMLEYLADQIVNHQFMGGFHIQTSELTMNKLLSVPLIGPFLAGQIMVDLSYTNIVPWDGNDFCIIGPGAEAGLNLMTDRQYDYHEMVSACIQLQAEQAGHFRNLYNRTGKNWKDIAYKDSLNGYPYLSVMDIQHDLCEFRKYNHWSSGKGKKKYYNRVLTDKNGSIRDANLQ